MTKAQDPKTTANYAGTTRTIERRAFPGRSVSGRWPHYFLVVDGVEVGTVRRVTAFGRDGLAGRRQPRGDAWEAGGVQGTSQQAAEEHLVRRAVRFGHLKGDA